MQKALSIRQPWASLIVWGLKSVEIRTWSTSYRGRMCIHAAKKIDQQASLRFGVEGAPLGALIGTVELVGVEPFTSESWAELADEHLDTGIFTPRLYGWRFDDPRPFDSPIPYRGDRGLFRVSEALPWPSSYVAERL